MKKQGNRLAWPIVDAVERLRGLGARRPAPRYIARACCAPERIPILVIEPVVLKQALDFEQLGEDGIAVDHRGHDR